MFESGAHFFYKPVGGRNKHSCTRTTDSRFDFGPNTPQSVIDQFRCDAYQIMQQAEWRMNIELRALHQRYLDNAAIVADTQQSQELA